MAIYKGTHLVSGKSSEIHSPTYVHEQGIAAAVWTINHNLGKYPSVTVVDSARNEITCSVQYTNTNTCVITMNGEFKGKAYLN